MATVLLVLVVVLVLAALVFGIVSLLSGDDPGLVPAEPDGRAVPLPNNRSLTETDLKTVRFDLGWRGYRMAQVDRVLRRTAYDVGYKDEMIAVLEAEVLALREGRSEDAELLRKARESAANPGPATDSNVSPDGDINLDPAATRGAPTSWELQLPPGASADSRSLDSRRADPAADGSRLADSRVADSPPVYTRPVDLEVLDRQPIDPDRADPDGVELDPVNADAVNAEPVNAEAGGAETGSVATADSAVAADLASGTFSREEDEAVRVEEARKEAGTPGTLADRATRKHAPSRTPGKSGRSKPPGRASGSRGGSVTSSRSAASSADPGIDDDPKADLIAAESAEHTATDSGAADEPTERPGRA